MATKEPWVVAGAHFDREPEFSSSEMSIVREKVYLILELSCWWLLMTEKPRRGNRNTTVMKSNQYTKLQEYSPE